MDPTATTASIAEVSELDPLVAGLTWGLTWLAAKYAIPDKFRSAIPVVALLTATGLVAALQTTQGDALTLQTVVRGLGAGAAAIAGHSGFREVQKALSKPEAAPADEPEVEEAEEAPAEE